MEYTNISLHAHPALSGFDRAVRGVISTAIFVGVLSSATLGAAGAFTLTIAGIYAGLTGLIGADPLRAVGRHLVAGHRPAFIAHPVAGQHAGTC